ncbi:MAG TPA: hypothetical protein PKZ06_00120 [Candidatus Pacearchaeota archaeon]|nr:hypothetical protein [Candidatus Pacearchaeota archaeon]
MRKKFVIIVLTVFLIASMGFIIAKEKISTNVKDELIACTMDVKMCPDGSYVGRIAPDCEFAPCPEENKEKISCKDLYWIDNTNKECSQKQFCGAFMYYGLYTFETKEECLKFLEDDGELIGASCGTVTPGYQNQCCIRKGYEGWDEQEFKCIGEKNRENKRERIRLQDGSTQNEIECPEGCVCSGSNVKCSFENGTRVMTVHAGNSGNTIIQIKNINASTNVTLYKQNEKVYGTFKDNETKEIVLPDQIMKKLKERKQKRLRLYNESIELGENGYYHVEMKKKSRLFLLVPVREHVRAEVNAETGEIVKIRNPWWGFLAKDIKEDIEIED